MSPKLSLAEFSKPKLLSAVLDLNRGEFQLDGHALPPAPTAFRLVAYFVQNHGQLLVKSEPRLPI